MRHARAIGANRREPAALLEEATITALLDGGCAAIELDTDPTEAVPATIAAIAGYTPSVGDRVLSAQGSGGAYVIAVIAASEPLAITAKDGATAAIHGGAIEIRGAEGRVIVRYQDGIAEISSPERDLVLAAPRGRVRVEAGLDVEIAAARDVVERAGRRVDLAAGDEQTRIQIDAGSASIEASRLEVAAEVSRVTAGEVEVVARSIATTAERILTRAVRCEVEASRLIEKARDAFRDVSDLFQVRIGRAKTIVSGTYSVHTRRTVMVSKDDTSIDGRKVLLG